MKKVYSADGEEVMVHSVDARELMRSGKYFMCSPHVKVKDIDPKEVNKLEKKPNSLEIKDFNEITQIQNKPIEKPIKRPGVYVDPKKAAVKSVKKKSKKKAKRKG